MKISIIYAAFFTIYLAAFAAVSTAQTVTGTIEKGLVTRGDTARGRVALAIPGGLHVNSNRPSSQYAIPTVVKISGAGLQPVAVSYPRGKNRKFQFSDEPINVYEGKVSFPFSVKVPQGFRGNIIRLRATVRYQACTEEVCYPPRTKEIILTARIR